MSNSLGYLKLVSIKVSLAPFITISTCYITLGFTLKFI